MIVFCALCRTAYVVKGDLQEMKSILRQPEWEHSFPCITPLCSGRLQETTPAKLRQMTPVLEDVKHVSLHGFYRAIHGFGMADGDPAPVALVRKLLLTKKIVDVHAEQIGQPERTILKRLILEDGTRLHFSRSTRGACLYYVEQPGPTCVEVFDGQLDNAGPKPDAVRLEGGEEDRRGPEDDEDGQAGCTAPGAEVPGAGLSSLQSGEAVLPDSGNANGG